MRALVVVALLSGLYGCMKPTCDEAAAHVAECRDVDAGSDDADEVVEDFVAMCEDTTDLARGALTSCVAEATCASIRSVNDPADLCGPE